MLQRATIEIREDDTDYVYSSHVCEKTTEGEITPSEFYMLFSKELHHGGHPFLHKHLAKREMNIPV